MKLLSTNWFIAALLLFVNYTHAQTPDTATTQKLLQYVFQPIDKNQVPTGILEEYGCPILPMATFKGALTDSNRIDMNLWRILYFQLQTGYCKTGTNPFIDITTVNSTIKQNSGVTLPIPIPILIGQYNTVKSNAFSSNLLNYTSNTKQIHDVAGRGQSPYQLNNLFAACPNKKQTIRGSETFICKSNLIWNNTGKNVSQIQIDFADGQGFQLIAINTPITVSYSSTGTKRWAIKVTLNDNSVLQCYSEFYVVKAAELGARFAGNQTVIPTWGNVYAVSGVHSGATIYVNYSNKNWSGTLRKPLIVVEGYDVSFRAPNLQDNYSFVDFIDGISLANTGPYDFNGQLDDVAGYDLVFIDFNDGADDLKRNAAVVQEVINRVNTNKVLDNRNNNIKQQNVVMGLSMGGLVARYVLASMTKSSLVHETRLLITHDSPHRGANVPLGLQYLIRMMGGFQLFGKNVYDIFPEYDQAIKLLDAPATQQLLLYRSVTANTYAANTFLDGEYRTMVTFTSGGPQPTYRFIATSQGNECAHNLFNPGKTFINLGAGISAAIDARVLFFRVPILSYKVAAEIEAYALPNTGSTAKIARLYTINNLKLFGFINIFKQLYNNTAYAPGSHLAADGVPGSNYPLLDFPALQQITTLPVFDPTGLFLHFPLGQIFGFSFGAYAYNQGSSFLFTFVPVGSALDVSPYNNAVFSEKYVNSSNQSYPSSSELFIAQESVTSQSLYNNTHIRFTARNSEWMYNEMEELNNSLSCSNECSNPYYIKGVNQFCTSATYSIPGISRGMTVSWSATPSNIVSLTPNGSSVAITKTGDGIITLNAAVNGSCSSLPPLTNSIKVGFP
ncbi:hypothetical protein C3K47_19125 [Solitalea longa]|uniref:GPI inositol-deacylase PGAP1-like alpha/beta domain-containing protein n=1 Tax=Solitalea longa TaxID=2079460 RepID=A0A2S4ZXM1_9SPHI|nr:hypothetical protein [Solitalea longa]POY34662.1 hypothetical protein C3K47_19125 [Solitalea longa]